MKKLLSPTPSRKQTGFTLLEVLVSGAVLSAALIALVVLLTYSIKSDDQARNRATAAELTQDGTDFFRQARNVLGWNKLRESLSDGATYCLDATQYGYDSMAANPDNFFSSLEGVCPGYNLNTIFKREAVVVVPVTDDDPIEIVVTVYWLTDGGETNTSSRLYLRPR